jgi:hypothetical protein
MKTALYKCTGYKPAKCEQQYRLDIERGPSTSIFCSTCNIVRSFLRVRGTTEDSVKKILHTRHQSRKFAVDTEASELDIRAACPVFFANPHGRRETYIVYRGCVIVRHTVTFTGCKPERLTVAYLFGRWPEDKTSDMFIAGPDYPERLTSIAHAKRHLDAILDSGKCWQDLQTV